MASLTCDCSWSPCWPVWECGMATFLPMTLPWSWNSWRGGMIGGSVSGSSSRLLVTQHRWSEGTKEKTYSIPQELELPGCESPCSLDRFKGERQAFKSCTLPLYPIPIPQFQFQIVANSFARGDLQSSSGGLERGVQPGAGLNRHGWKGKTLLHKTVNAYMGGISQDVKRLNMWDCYPLFFGF